MYDKEEIQYLSNTLKNYYYLKKKAKEIEWDIIDLNMQIEECKTYISANAYDNVIAGSGCSVVVPKPKKTPEYVNQQMILTKRKDELVRKYSSLDKDNRLTERISKLKTESQIIINNYYQRELTISEIAKLEGNVSKQTISNRLNQALREMLKI